MKIRAFLILLVILILTAAAAVLAIRNQGVLSARFAVTDSFTIPVYAALSVAFLLGVALVITASEEIGCEGAKFLADAKLLDRAGAIVVAEPTANYPSVGHKGLAWFEIETTGVTAHGSMPEVGENAILKMARVIGDLEGFRFPVASHPIMGEPTLNVNMDFDGFFRPVDLPGTGQEATGTEFDLGAFEFTDGDGDGLPDYWERLHNLDPTVPDSDIDDDDDGLDALGEYTHNTQLAIHTVLLSLLPMLL